MVKGVIFDMDGVLVDTEPSYYECKKRYVEECGFVFTHEQLCRLIGVKLQDAVKYSFPELSDAQKDRLIKGFKQVPDIDYKACQNPKAVAAMKIVKNQGLKLAVASSSPMRRIEAAIDVCGFREYIDVYVSGEIFERSKPDPAIYRYTVDKLGFKPGECMAVEDSDYGLEAAYNAGCTVVCKRDGRFGYQQKQAHWWINELDEIKGILDDLINK